MGKRVGLLAVAVGVLSGCNPSVADYCAPGTPECTPADGGGGPDGPGGSEASPDVGGCDPSKSPSEEACVVAEAYGVFVSPAGSDSNAGTRSAPVATLGHGIDVAKATGKRVYVCAGSFGEELVIGASRDGVNVYGGLDCAGWTYGAGNHVVVAPAGAGYALEVEDLQTGVTLEDLEFDSQSASGPGESSIAAFASNSQNVVLERLTLVAAAAAGGSAGATSGPGADAGPTNWYGTPPAYPELNGASASDAGAAPATTCTCGDQSSSTGGAGSGPSNVPPPTGGLPSYGDAGAGAPGMNGVVCGNGGSPNANGADAPPASSSTPSASLGACSASGWTPAVGVAGANGPPGQGGGGGGDGKFQSGAGGGGACGGCGGTGGTAGAGGGSSIALLAYQSSVTLVDCLLTAKSAGNGGAGGSGEQGQGGGVPGSGSGQGSGVGCSGGPGGAGAGGNGGQGGAGGLSLGIGYCGTAPTVGGAVVSGAASLGGVTLGSAGAGAAGGSGGAAATNSTDPAGANGASGPAGVAMAVRSLP